MNAINCLQLLKDYMLEKKLNGEIRYRAEYSHLVRAANNNISLDTTEIGQSFSIELQEGKRFYRTLVVASCNEIDKIKAAIDLASINISIMPEIPFAKGMERIAESSTVLSFYDSDTEILSRGEEFFHSTISRFSSMGVTISGVFSSGSYEYGIMNTLSQNPLYYKGSDFEAEIVLQMIANKKEVRATQVDESFRNFEPNKLWSELELYLELEKLPFIAFQPQPIDIVFGKDAFSSILMFLLWLGLSGEVFEYEMGMLQKSIHKIGDKLFGDNITLLDSPIHPDVLFKRPFGLNGLARPSVSLIENGTLTNLVYSEKLDCDRFNKIRNNDVKALNLILLGGDGPTTFESMVASCKNPTLYIPYLHYLNSPNRAKGEFTGTSRFGTFLIEDGKAIQSLNKIRILDSLWHIFNNIEWLSSQLAKTDCSNSYDQRLAFALTLPQFIKIKGVSAVEN